MRRVLIIGCGGAGKSTLSRRLARRTRLPLVHLDRLYWMADWREVDTALFHRRLARVLQASRWIMDGNYGSTLPQRLALADTVVFLDLPTPLCLWGICKRILTWHGRTRPDLSPGNPERFDWEFTRYVTGFRRHHRPRLLRHLRESDARVIRLRSRAAVRAFLNRLNQVDGHSS